MLKDRWKFDLLYSIHPARDILLVMGENF